MEYEIYIKNITKEHSCGCFVISSEDKMVLTEIVKINMDETPRRDDLNLLISAIDKLPKNCKIVTIVSDSKYLLFSFSSHDKITKQPRDKYKHKQHLDLVDKIRSKLYGYRVFSKFAKLEEPKDDIFEIVQLLLDKLITGEITESVSIKDEKKLFKLIEPKPKLKVVIGTNIDEKFVKASSEHTPPEKIDYINQMAPSNKPMNTEDVIITAEYERVFGLIELNENFIFVTGNAGTGKSVLIHQIQKKFYRKNVVVCAPTGLAALNIGGATLHSIFCLPAKLLDASYIQKMNIADIKSLVCAIDILIIDEISMVRCDLLDAINIIFQRACENKLLFGGKIVIGVGDLFQLPPVVSDEDTTILNQLGYKSEFFFSALCIRAINYEIVELGKIYRQKDEHFKMLLNKLRIGEDIDFVINKINERFNMPGGEDGVTLATTNKIVDSTNKLELDKIKSRKHEYNAVKTGVFLSENVARKPSPDVLELKVGAKVMFVQNNVAKGYVNGTLGIIMELEPNIITVQSEDGSIIYVTQAEWESLEYKFNKDTKSVDANVNGTYKQFPLILAWAITIHKSQGKTLSKVYLDLGWGAFAPGQLYVALSRMKTFDGLSLKKCVQHKDVIVSDVVVNYYNRKIKK